MRASLKRSLGNLAREARTWAESLAPPTSPEASGTGALSPLAEVDGFGSNPGQLAMFAYVPGELAPRPALVVVLHGCTQSARGYDHGAGWSTLADRYGFALLFPQQRRKNNPQLCFNWFRPGDASRDQGEALSIRQMVAHMVPRHGLDPARVFVTGLSAGGAMTGVMLATYPEVFAGGAIIAGIPYGAARNVKEALAAMYEGVRRSPREWGDLVRAASPHRGPWPKVSVWHGSADATVLPVNADETLKQWTDVHGLGSARPAEDVVDGYPRRLWRDAAGREVVEAFTITGMGHGTPLGSGPDRHGAAGPFLLDVGIASSYHIAKFWGLTDRRLRTSEGVLGEPGGRAASPEPRLGGWPSRQPRPAVDVGAAVARALKAAGLFRS